MLGRRAAQTGTMALALVAGGCAVGPAYEPPGQAMPIRWAEPVEGGLSARAADLARWWTVLGDATLEGLMERAAAGNLDLRAAKARLAEARGQRGVAGAAQWPEVDATGSYGRTRSSAGGPAGARGENDLFIAGFDASWEIDLWGRVRRNVEAADADVQAAEEDQRDVLVTLLAEVARNYVELRGLQERQRIAEENVEVQRQTLDLSSARYAAGLTSELDVQRARAQWSTTQSQVPALRAEVRRTAHRLGVLLGEEPGSLLVELEHAAPIPLTPGEVPMGLPTDLLRRRPDIRRAERQIAAATARIGVATADLFPRFSLTGSFGFENSRVGGMFDAPNRFWSFGPAMKWPVFEAGRIRANIGVQEARTEEALALYQKTVLGALEETENSMVSYAREQERRDALRVAVEAQKRAVELAGSLHEAQLTDFLTVLDAERQRFVLEDQWVQSRTAVTTNLVRLYKALGGGWAENGASHADLRSPAGKTLDGAQD